MQKIGFFLIAMLGLVPAYAACVIKDDAGEIIQLKQPAKRIISLAPDITETLFAIGAGQQVMAVMSGSDYPPAARQLPIIGSYSGIDLERMVSMRPDLIVTWSNTFARQLKVLKKSGIAIYTVEPRHLEDIPRTMKNLACLTGTKERAHEVAAIFSEGLTKLSQQYQSQTPISVFYQIGAYSLITINKESWINQALTLCGGKNIFADANMIAPQVSWEAVITRNPQVIMSGENDDAWKTRWQRWTSLRAVKNQFLFSVPPDLLHRAGPRLVEGVAKVCADLQQVRAKHQINA
jgi:iron complex transport system substrate-binding protein